jgi:hypothetical protein
MRLNGNCITELSICNYPRNAPFCRHPPQIARLARVFFTGFLGRFGEGGVGLPSHLEVLSAEIHLCRLIRVLFLPGMSRNINMIEYIF